MIKYVQFWDLLSQCFFPWLSQMLLYFRSHSEFPLQVSTRFSSDFLPSCVSLSNLLSVSILPSGLSSGIIVPFFFRDRQLHKAGTLKFCQVSIAVWISGERAYPQCRFDEFFYLMAVLSGEMLTLMFQKGYHLRLREKCVAFSRAHADKQS